MQRTRKKGFLQRIILLTILALFICLANVYCGQIIERSQEGYCLSVPKSVSENRAMPILICLPGWGIQAKNDINLWAFQAQKRGFILIEMDVNYSSFASGSGAQALYQKMQGILSSLAKDYSIDENKIFIAGTSAGGMMAIALSLYFPGKFKAVGVVSGGRLGFGAKDYLNNAQRQLYCFYHGKKDKSIPIGEFYSTKKKLERNGAIIEFKIIEEGRHTLPTGCYKEVVDWFYQLIELSM